MAATITGGAPAPPAVPDGVAPDVDAEVDAFLDELLDALDLSYGALAAHDRRREAQAWHPPRPCRCARSRVLEPSHCHACGRDLDAGGLR